MSCGEHPTAQLIDAAADWVVVPKGAPRHGLLMIAASAGSVPVIQRPFTSRIPMALKYPGETRLSWNRSTKAGIDLFAD
jgi:hypothetical protein